MAKKGITLIGMPGSGKSTLGKLLAVDLNLRFLDLDQLITETLGMPINVSIATHGEEAFLALEEKLTLQLALHNVLLSPGGSIVYQTKAMEKIRRETTVIYLHVPKTILKKRLTDNGNRGIIGLDKYGFDGLFALRKPLYEQYADMTIT